MKSSKLKILIMCAFLITGITMSAGEIKIKVNKKYLNFPISNSENRSKMTFKVEGQPDLSVVIRLAPGEPDYWVFKDVSDIMGKTLTIVYEGDERGLSKLFQDDVIVGDETLYKEKYRPQFHFTTRRGWINDPNGMVYYDGEYHLFYQHNPYEREWENMHWGHAVSKDLISWEHLPTALPPDQLGGVFSGSAVIDRDNTAGFGKDALIAIFTSAGEIQTQSIAYSLDNGRTFTKYDGNPVLSDLKYPDFRDPKVFWHNGTNQWVMSLATGQTITFYGSKNLKEWNRLSEFGEGIGSHAGVWECPDLFPLTYNGQTKWVLFVSINPGGPNGGSATQYFIGDFDGTTFTPDALPYPIWLDYGRDNYAGVTWINIPDSDGRRLFIGWMNNWDYARKIPPLDFNGAMTLPRELKLAHNGTHLILANPPVEEVKALRGDAKEVESFIVKKSHSIDNLADSGLFELEMDIEAGNCSAFNIVLCNEIGEKILFVFDLEKGTFVVDRSESGAVNFSDEFAGNKSEGPLVKKESYHVRLFVDAASTECFVDNGELVQTNTVFPSEPYNSLSFESEEEITISNFKIFPIKK